ncbi:MAG: site-specific DNA-methyltransferase [Thermodesulfobacteriota bacterium]
MAGKKGDTPTPILDYKYQEKRKNIPTHELRDFVADLEKTPKDILYPRDPSLDPQLVWKGKDEQDREDLAVPAVPVYIQEKILPRAIIEEVRAQARKDKPEPQASLFADFNGIDFEDLVDFYRHEQNWSNRLILGDSLLVMNSLAEKEGLKGQVQMIYIDPPYGIKFGSNWQVSTRKREVKDGKIGDLTRQPEQVRAYRDTWKLGIHSYLAYLRDRLVVARELLTETGSIFVQIGDENVHLVRALMDEVFGSDNFCALITLWKTSGATTTRLPTVSDYLLWYAENIEQVKYRQLYMSKELGEEGGTEYKSVELHDGTRRSLSKKEFSQPDLIPNGSRLFRPSPMTSQSASSTTTVAFKYDGIDFLPGSGGWKTNQEGFLNLVNAGRILRRDKSLSYVRYLEDFPVVPITNLWLDTRWGFDASERIYVVQTNVKAVQRCLLMTTDPGDLVLDPTCGSGTTAYVAEQWGRRWITLDTSRVALALARTRLMAAKYPYYLLADTPEGVKKEGELTGKMPPDYKTEGDLKKGFVYKRVPHITLKSIANNEEIDAIHAKWQEKLDPLRQELNRTLNQTWEEWQIPREPEESWPQPAKDLLTQWWSLRRERQQEVDASIARRADTELLYDQPYEDGKRLRVTGPFTVESLSPHRVLAPEVEIPDSQAQAQREADLGQFETMILDNLKKAGVQNTIKNERLKFDRLEPYAGEWLHAAGEYTETDGASRRVAVCIGPEHGTVGPELVKEAAKEAVRGLGFDLLIICGFAFDPHVSEEAKRYGKLPVLTCRMNPDLAMGDELLKKTGAGNLFMVFGEPDVEVRPQKDGKLVVEIKGLDIYDPTTGQIRSSSTDDIACWFIDTNYNGESFFVRHAYFTGADQPYDKLKRALRADIDEAAWSALYSTTSRPFPKPATNKIAIKVINHYGDEVLKVFEV